MSSSDGVLQHYQARGALRFFDPREAENRRQQYQRRVLSCTFPTTAEQEKQTFLTSPASIKVTFKNKSDILKPRTPTSVIATVRPQERDEHHQEPVDPYLPKTPGHHYINAHSHSYNAWGEFLPIIEESIPMFIHMSYADCITTQQAIQEQKLKNPITLYRVAPAHVFGHHSNSMNFPRPHLPSVVEDWDVANW